MHIRIAYLPSMPSRVPSGHATKSSISYLHSPTVRPKDIVRLSGDPLIQDSLRRTCPQYGVSYESTPTDLRRFFRFRGTMGISRVGISQEVGVFARVVISE